MTSMEQCTHAKLMVQLRLWLRVDRDGLLWVI